MKSNHGFKVSGILFCLFLFAFPQYSHSAALSKVDNILEGVVLLNKRTHALPDNQAIFKQSETFENLIKKEPNLVNNMRRKTTKLADAQADLRKLNLPPGSKLADEFLSLPPAGRYAVSQLADTTQVILKLPDGMDVLTRLDKSGLLLIQRFGTDVVNPISFVVKNDEIWDGAATTFKALGGMEAAQIRKLYENLKILPFLTNPRILNSSFSNADRVRLSYQVIKKYGKKGFDELVKLTKSTWGIAKRNPKKAALGAAIAVVWVYPDMVLDPLGHLKNNAVRTIERLGTIYGEFMVEAPVAFVGKVGEGAKNKIIEHMPDMPAAVSNVLVPIIVWFVSISGFLLLLYLIPPWRFIPKAIAGWVFRILKAPFHRTVTK